MERTPEPEVMDDRLEVDAYEQADFRGVNRRCARRALRVAARARGRAVDLGCGPADIPIELCRLAPGWKVTAVDLSPKMLARARAHVRADGLEDRIRVVRADASGSSRLGGPFDLVMSNSILHHLESPVSFWRQVRRLVKPGGAVMVQDLTRPASRREAKALERLHVDGESRLLRQLFYDSLLAAYTPGEVRAQLREAGLTGLNVRMINDRHLVVRGRPSG